MPITNPFQIENIVPDYTAGVTLNVDTLYTAEETCFVSFRLGSNNRYSYGNFKIDDNVVFERGQGTIEGGLMVNGDFLVAKNSTYKLTISGGSTVNSYKKYSLRGVV